MDTEKVGRYEGKKVGNPHLVSEIPFALNSYPFAYQLINHLTKSSI